MRVGIEVGGTFTDLVAVEADRALTAKVPSTPANPDIGAMDALAAAGIDPAVVTELVHGSTVTTNAVLERRGARLCLFVTRGTRDILLLQRHDRTSIYDLRYRKPEPVVARRDTFEVAGRVTADGTVLEPLDPGDARELIVRALGTRDYDAAAVCFLHAYANPEHERAFAALLREAAPDLAVTCSSDVAREFREYERASTTTLAAYVQPVMAGYVSRFHHALERKGFRGRFSIMQSNGGRMPAQAVARNAIAALFSGPAAGVIGAVRGAVAAGYRDLITLDMGGTSTDVCLVRDAVPDLVPMTRVDGLPVKTPVIDIVTVGAGGGSIAWVDDGGLLRVGPRSAGAHPGPACYGRGGTLPTVTDAHLVRGTLPEEGFLDGTMSIDAGAARESCRDLAGRFSMSVQEMADSVVRLADASIVRAIQQVSTERGRDPRDHVLVPYGGAGPLHAARVAEELGIATVVVPPHAGVMSALGLLRADHVVHRSRTRPTPVSRETVGQVVELLEELEREARKRLAAPDAKAVAIDRMLDMRYPGQAFEIPVAVADLSTLTAPGLAGLFADAHRRAFAFAKPPDEPVEVICARVAARIAPLELPDLPLAAPARAERTTNLVERGVSQRARLLARAAVPEQPVPGTLLITDGGSTVHVPPGWTARRDSHGNLVLGRA